ncbi:MAG: RNA-binding domain-containing protein [bacterium]
MTQEELKGLLDELRALSKETEWVEFKKAEQSFDFEALGQYFSALSNEANLKGKPSGWLIFGIEDKTHNIVGTQYRQNRIELDNLKLGVANQTTNRITFQEIYELTLPEGRVILFQIPAAPPGIPIAWKGHYYGRDGTSIGALNIQEIEQIRLQRDRVDWSAGICSGATIADLDEKAINQARENYKKKFPVKAIEVDQWDNITFLNKAKLTINGQITRTAIILLGKEESEHYLSPGIAKISWILKDEKNQEKDYAHFGPPFLLQTGEVFAKIRNLTYRYMSNSGLFPTEITKYDPYVIREALHNCIAHQDYELHGRISVVEFPDELLFTNPGSFIPGSVETVIIQDAPQQLYRNPFLANAMVNLNMIDTVGGGIKKMFTVQRTRNFPMPEYDLTQRGIVKVKIIGKVLDENYTRILIKNNELDLITIMYLDRVQKKENLTKEEYNILKSKRLVEGRYPNLFVASRIAATTEDKATYIKHRAFDKKHYKDMVIAYLKEYGSASRKDINSLLKDKLPDLLNENQKENRITNLIYEMSKKDKTIKNTGSYTKSNWVLVD